MIVMPTTRLKSSTTRYRVTTRWLRNADIEQRFSTAGSRPSNAGQGNVRPAGHIRPAKYLNVARELHFKFP